MLPSTAKSLSTGRDSGLDASAVSGAWAAVRAAFSAAAFLLVAVSKTNAIEVVGAPTDAGGFGRLEAELLGAPDRVLYGACPFSRGGQQRWCFFSWVGAGVGGMARARVSLQRGGVYKALEGCSAELQWMGDAAEIKHGAVLKALAALPGAGEVEVP